MDWKAFHRIADEIITVTDANQAQGLSIIGDVSDYVN